MVRPSIKNPMNGVFNGVFPRAFQPSALFSVGVSGAWYDPSDISTLFQDSAGTTPVTSPGQSVGLIKDKSGPESQLQATFQVREDEIYADRFNAQIHVLNTGPDLENWTLYFTLGGADILVIWNAELLDSADGNFKVIGAGWTTSIDNGDEVWFGVTVSGQPEDVDLSVLDRLHASQATSGNRPVYAVVPNVGRRNLANPSEDFTGILWEVKSNGSGVDPVVTGNYAVGPFPGTQATRIVFDLGDGSLDNDSSEISNKAGSTPGTYSLSVWVKSNTGTDQEFLFSIGNRQLRLYTATNNWQRVTDGHAFNQTHANGIGFRIRRDAISANTSDILFWGAQFELSDSVTAYQKVVSDFDVSEAGTSSLGYLARTDVAQTLEATFPNLGTNATIATATEGGVSISSGQTVGSGAYDILQGEETYSHIVVNRYFRLSESNDVRQYLRRKSV